MINWLWDVAFVMFQISFFIVAAVALYLIGCKIMLEERMEKCKYDYKDKNKRKRSV